MKKFALMTSVAALLSLAACGKPAETGGTSTGAEAVGDAAQDAANAAGGAISAVTQTSPADFVTQMAQSDMYEVEAGKLAAKRSKNADIKAFANELVKAHTATSAELKPLAQAATLTIPTALDQAHADMLENLRTATDADFDEKYLDQQESAHSAAHTLLSNFASGQDVPELRAFAAKTAPVVQAHLDKVKALDDADADENPKQPGE